MGLTTNARDMVMWPQLGNARERPARWVARAWWGMGRGLSMGAKREITKKDARENGSASKKVRGRLLDELVATTGWSRANTRRQVAAVGQRKGPQRAVARPLLNACRRDLSRRV